MHRMVTLSVAFALLVSVGPAWSQQCPHEIARWGYGPARVIAVDGDTSVFTSGIVLMVGDVSDPAHPVVIGEMPLEGELMQVGATFTLVEL